MVGQGEVAMRWKPEIISGAVRVEAERPDETIRSQVCADLEARGVGGPAAELLAEQLAGELEPLGGEAYASTLDGVALTCRAQTRICEDLVGSARDLQEIERLMGSFAGELSKLDETLEVLAAYLRRMRATSPAVPPHLIH